MASVGIKGERAEKILRVNPSDAPHTPRVLMEMYERVDDLVQQTLRAHKGLWDLYRAKYDITLDEEERNVRDAILDELQPEVTAEVEVPEHWDDEVAALDTVPMPVRAPTQAKVEIKAAVVKASHELASKLEQLKAKALEAAKPPVAAAAGRVPTPRKIEAPAKPAAPAVPPKPTPPVPKTYAEAAKAKAPVPKTPPVVKTEPPPPEKSVSKRKGKRERAKAKAAKAGGAAGSTGSSSREVSKTVEREKCEKTEASVVRSTTQATLGASPVPSVISTPVTSHSDASTQTLGAGLIEAPRRTAPATPTIARPQRVAPPLPAGEGGEDDDGDIDSICFDALLPLPFNGTHDPPQPPAVTTDAVETAPEPCEVMVQTDSPGCTVGARESGVTTDDVAECGDQVVTPVLAGWKSFAVHGIDVVKRTADQKWERLIGVPPLEAIGVSDKVMTEARISASCVKIDLNAPDRSGEKADVCRMAEHIQKKCPGLKPPELYTQLAIAAYREKRARVAKIHDTVDSLYVNTSLVGTVVMASHGAAMAASKLAHYMPGFVARPMTAVGGYVEAAVAAIPQRLYALPVTTVPTYTLTPSV
jgi:hypothetical protein